MVGQESLFLFSSQLPYLLKIKKLLIEDSRKSVILRLHETRLSQKRLKQILMEGFSPLKISNS